MSAAAALAVVSRHGEDDATAELLWQAINPEFLRRIRWNAQKETITFPVGDPLFVGHHASGDQLSRSRGHRGSCEITLCPRLSAGRYCPPHRGDWVAVKRAHSDVTEAAWRATLRADLEDGEIDLRGIAPLVVVQLLAGLAELHRKGAKIRFAKVVGTIRWARYRRCRSMRDVQVNDDLRTGCLVTSERALLDPDTERAKDSWNMSAFGYGGVLRFGDISQEWLREAVKLWAYDFLPTRKGHQPARAVQERISAIARLSESLRLQRLDKGENYVQLSAADITAFCNRIAYLHSTGEITARLRLTICLLVRVVLDGLRKLGLTRQGKLLAGLPDDFALRRGQVPDETEDDEPGRDVPKEVMRVICDHLPELGRMTNLEIQTAVELLIDTGRRPGEIRALAYDCLQRDAQGQPVLIYDNVKARRYGRRLPIS